MFLNGALNTAFLGIPLYIYIWVFLVIMTALVYAGMYYLKWKPLTPLHGLYYALKNQSTVAFIFDSFLVGELVAERDAKCIFNYADDEYEIDIPDHPFLDNLPMFKKVQTWWYTKIFYYPTLYLKDITPTKAMVFKIGKVNKDVEIARLLEGGNWERSAAVVCAGVPVDIVVDMDKWTLKGTAQHKAIVRVARGWNEANPTDQIHSYQKFQAYLMDNKIPCPKGIQITHLIPWQRVDAAFPLDLDENEWAGKKRQMAKDLEDSELGLDKKFATYLIIAGVGFAFLVFLGRWSSIIMK